MIKYTHFYDKNKKLVATLATDHSDTGFKIGVAVVKSTEPIASKRRGREIAEGRLSTNYSLDKVPNKKVTDYTGSVVNLKELIESNVNHSKLKFDSTAR